MKQKRMKAAVVLAVATMLTASTVGACANIDESTPPLAENASVSAQQTETVKPSVTDGKFTVTLEETVVFENRLAFAYSVEGVTQEAETELMKEDFDSNVSLYTPLETGMEGSFIRSPIEIKGLRTETKKYFTCFVEYVYNPQELEISFRLNKMEGFRYIDLPTNTSAEVLNLTLPSPSGENIIVQLSPLDITIEKNCPAGFEEILGNLDTFFRMADGSVKTFHELFSSSRNASGDSPVRWEHNAEARTILDLSQIQSIIVENLEYDLRNPAQGKEAALDELLRPFAVSLTYEENDFLVPVKDIIERLGGEVALDEAGRRAVVQYRGSTVELRAETEYYVRDGISFHSSRNQPVLMMDGGTLLMKGNAFRHCFYVDVDCERGKAFEGTAYIIP